MMHRRKSASRGDAAGGATPRTSESGQRTPRWRATMNMQTRTRRLLSGDGGSSAKRSSGVGGGILDANVARPRGEVSADAYLVLFGELVSYSLNRVKSVAELDRKLSEVGYRMGRRTLELIAVRERAAKRETSLLGILNFVSLTLWRFLFGRQADSLKKVRNSDEYYIEEAAPMVNRFISVPKDYGDLNCAAFCAGIINGVLDAAGFRADVAVKVLGKSGGESDADDTAQPLTLYYIKFAPEVLEREKRLGH